MKVTGSSLTQDKLQPFVTPLVESCQSLFVMEISEPWPGDSPLLHVALSVFKEGKEPSGVKTNCSLKTKTFRRKIADKNTFRQKTADEKT